MVTTFARLAGAAALAALAACTPSAASSPVGFDIAMCPEPWQLSRCSADAGGQPGCTFSPAAGNAVAGQPLVWAYDAEGAEINHFALPLVAGRDGAPQRVQLALPHAARPVHRVVVCSVDPHLPVVRERIVPVMARGEMLSN